MSGVDSDSSPGNAEQGLILAAQVAQHLENLDKMAGDDVEMKPKFPKWNVKTEFSGGDTDEQTNSRACKKFVDDVKYETKSAKWGGIWKSIDKRVTEAVYDTTKFDAAEKDTAGEIANNMMQALDGAARTLVENALSTKQIVEDCPAGIIRIFER